MFAVGNVPSLGDLGRILGWKLAQLPMTYLGLPLGAKFKSKLIWNPVIEKLSDVSLVGSVCISAKGVGWH